MTALHALNRKGSQAPSSYHTLKQPITETEYWETYYNQTDRNYEWNNGKLEEKPVSDLMTYLMYKWFLELMDYFLQVNPVADLMGLEMGFRLVLPQKITIRKPDLAVVRHDNPVPLYKHDLTYKGTFDLCIEALSDSSAPEKNRDTITKKGEYAAAGVKEYYILYGHGSPMEFYRLNKQGLYVPIKRTSEEIIQSQVLPGFQFRISDLFKQPSPDEMIDDPIYQDFVLPGYSKAKKQVEVEKKRVKAANKRVDAEKKRADAEKIARQKAEAEIVRLKALLTKI